MEQDANVKVFCRIRPPNDRERGVKMTNLSASSGFLTRNNVSTASTSFTKKCVTVPTSDSLQQTVFIQSQHHTTKTFTFDRVFDENASQNDIFEVVGAPITQACLEGYNGTIFAYGQTGSGKTFTMQGPDDVIDTDTYTLTESELSLRGLVPRVFDYLFENVVAKETNNKVQHTFACSFLEIYNERVYDLLDGGSAKDAAGLQLRENGRKGVHAEGLIESVVTSSKKAAELMTIGARNRRVGQTSMNRESSRSHSVFILQLHSKEILPEGMKIRTSRFNLVDLAGSERQRSTDAAGERLKEAGNINKSLSALGNVILGLSEQSMGKHRHVHYRDSKLTFLLKDSLGGNSKTFMIATISPAEDSASETLSTLKFAQRAKMIQNSAVVNEDSVGSAFFLQEEVRRLRRQLQQAHQEAMRNVRGPNVLLQPSATRSDVTSSQDSGAVLSQQYGPCDPAIDTRFRELEESFATTAEKNDRLLRSVEFLQLQNGNFQALCSDLKQSVTHLKMMLRLRGISGTGLYDYTPSADAIEWRMKYEEMEERCTELQEKMQRSSTEDVGVVEKAESEVESVNIMLLSLTKQLAFVLREKHDLQDRLVASQADQQENMEGSTLQKDVDADFSARLEESLKQQANEYQAKVDSAAAIIACLEEKAAETSLELIQMKELEASWSIQQQDLEYRLAHSTEALQDSEKAQSLTQKLLIQEKTRVEELQVQLDRARESAELEFEAALADAATATRSIEQSKRQLEYQLTVVKEDLKQRECQVQEANNGFAQLKVEMAILEEANQRAALELREAQGELISTAQQAADLRAEMSERENVIDEQKRHVAMVIEEKNVLEQNLVECKTSIRQLQEAANVTAQHHIVTLESLKRQAQENAQMLTEDCQGKLRVKDEKLQQLYAEFGVQRGNAEEAGRLYSLMLKEKNVALTVLQQQIDDQKQEHQLALREAEETLLMTRADLSALYDEKNTIESDRISAMQEIGSLRNDAKKLYIEKDALANEIQSLSQHSNALLVKTKELDDQNAELQKQCDLHQAQLSYSDDTITRLTQEVEELQQQTTSQSSKIASLDKELALAQEECRRAATTHSEQLDKLASDAKTIEEQQQKLVEKNDIVKDMASNLEKALGEIQIAEGHVSRQQEEINMHKEIQSTLRGELKSLENDHLKLAEALKTEQESKRCIEKNFAVVQEEWKCEKDELEQHFRASILALEKRVDDLVCGEKTLSALKRNLEQENERLKTSVAKQIGTLQQLEDKKIKIIELESNAADAAAVQDKLASNVAELQSCLRDLKDELTQQQTVVSKYEAELAEKSTAILERDGIIATMKDCASNDKTAWDMKEHEFKAELGAAYGQVQAFELLVLEKTAAFGKVEKALLAEKYSLEQKLEEGEEILAQQTEQLMQEIKQLGATVEQKDEQIQLVNQSLAELKDRWKHGDCSDEVKELQVAMEDLETKHKLVESENTSLKKAVFEIKEQEDKLNCRRSELDVAEEQTKLLRKAWEAEKASAQNALKESKATTMTQDVLVQAKRKFLAEKVKLQREIQTLIKKTEVLSKENEKLVGHRNSRQKIQHHVKVKEENNRLLDQVRLLTDDKLKLQRSLEKLRMTLKEKENIVESAGNTPSYVSPLGNGSSRGLLPVKRPSLGSASSATAGTLASASRAAARLALRSRSTSRSASPGPIKKRARSNLSSSGPGWQR